MVGGPGDEGGLGGVAVQFAVGFSRDRGAQGSCPRQVLRPGARLRPVVDRPQRPETHAVAGECAGLVRADDTRGAEGLHGAEPFDQGTAAGQGADSDGQGQRDGRKESLRDVGDEQSDGERQGVGDRKPDCHAQDEKHDAHAGRDSRR